MNMCSSDIQIQEALASHWQLIQWPESFSTAPITPLASSQQVQEPALASQMPLIHEHLSLLQIRFSLSLLQFHITCGIYCICLRILLMSLYPSSLQKCSALWGQGLQLVNLCTILRFACIMDYVIDPCSTPFSILSDPSDTTVAVGALPMCLWV